MSIHADLYFEFIFKLAWFSLLEDRGHLAR